MKSNPLLRVGLWSCGLLLITLPLPAQTPAVAPPAPTVNAALHRIFTDAERWEEEQDQGLWPDVSPRAQAKRSDYYSALQKRLDSIDRAGLSRADRVNYDLFRFNLADQIAEYEFSAYLMPLNAEGGFYNALAFLSNRNRFSRPEQYREYLRRLQAFPAYMRANVELMRLGLKQGIVVPRLVAENYRGLIEPFLRASTDGHPLYAAVEGLPAEWPEAQRDSFTRATAALIRDSIAPVYAAFADFMEKEYLARGRNSIGISEIPNGRAYYQQRVAYFTTLNITPDEVFEIGQREVSRIRADMEQIIHEVGFEGTFAEFLDFLRTDPQFYAKTPDELLKEAAWLSKRIDGKLPEYFGKLPRLPYGVEPVPAAIAPNYTGGRYSPGSVRGNRAGNYWVNTYKLESRPLYVLPALTLHEAVPGHHLQISLAAELEGLPRFRASTYVNAFGEGWGLYSEWLGQEMGIYRTPYEQFGRMTYEMWRACRLVVDVGMHYKGWSREQALKFLSENTALSLHECNTEIDRYIGWPGQAVSYKMGELKIRELRRRAEEELGDRFNIRDFHDAVLRNGAVPLFILEEEIERFIQEHKGQNR